MLNQSTDDPLYLGIDFGTSGVRGAVIDRAGQQQVSATTTLPAPVRDGARVEQDPALWLNGLTMVLNELGADWLARVRAIAVDGTSSTLLLADCDGRPLAPALMYNDARATAEATLIATRAPADSAARGAGSSLAKLLWLLDRHRSGAAHALHQADWIGGWLSGDPGHSDENNCLKLGYDPQARAWPDWVAGLLPDPELLPRVQPPGTVVDPIDRAIATRFGLPTDALVVSGTTDSTAAFIATGADRVGDAVTTLGSTLVLKVLCSEPVASPAHGVYSHRLGDLWLAGGASNSGGAVLRRFFDDHRMVELTRELDFANPTGLDYYPLPGPGERFPISDPSLPPRLDPRPASDARFFQGLLEGIAAIELRGYQVLQQLGAPRPTRVLSSGGGASNRPWGEMRQRLLGVPEARAERTDAAYGAALLALRGAPD